MTMSAHNRDIIRNIRKNLNKFISMALIVALTCCVAVGIKATGIDMEYTADQYYDRNNFMDMKIISNQGFPQDEPENLGKYDFTFSPITEGRYSQDIYITLEDNQYVSRVMSVTESINQLELISGRYPQTTEECIFLSRDSFLSTFALGDKISCDVNGKETELTIVGFAYSPEYITMDLGASSLGNGKLQFVIYTLPDFFSGHPYAEILIHIEELEKYDTYSEEYSSKISDLTREIEEYYAGRDVFLMNRNMNIGYSNFEGDSERINAVSNVFPFFFFLVAALVCTTTMTRMIEEDRGSIGTMKALGYSTPRIAVKYLTYSGLSTLIGGIVGICIGFIVFPKAIYSAYLILYNLPPVLTPFWPFCALSVFIPIFAIIIAVTFAVCYSSLRSTPARLMRPKAPKPGRRIILEHIPFLWKRMKFLQKVTARNIFRFAKRFLMTVTGIASCTALLLSSFGLKDAINDIVEKQCYSIHKYDCNGTLATSLVTDGKLSFDSISPEALQLYLSDFAKVEDIAQRHNVQYILTYEKYTQIQSDNGSMNAYLFIPYQNDEENTIDEYISFRTRETFFKSSKEIGFNEDSLILTEKLAKELNVSVGDTINFEDPCTQKQHSLKVSGITENYIHHYAYIHPDLYEETFGTTPIPTNFLAIMNGIPSNASTADITLAEDALSTELLKIDMITAVSFMTNLKVSFDDMISNLNIIVVILIVSAALLAFIVLYNLSNINITERKRELATIKVLGFRDKEVSMYISKETIWLTVIGIFIGLIFGIFLNSFIVTTCEVDFVMFSRDISVQSFILSTVLTLIFTLIVAIVMHWRLKNISMTDSLKSVD